MIKLLRANFYRLTKEISTYVLIGASAITALFVIFIYLIFANVSEPGVMIPNIDGQTLFISGAQLGQNVGILLAVGVALCAGKDFSQNTIRNKIIIGYSKIKIYLANLIISVALSLLIYLSFQFFIFTLGIPILGWGSTFILADFLRMLINSICILVTFTAVLNMITMLSKSLVTGMVTGLIGTVLCVALFSGLQSIPVKSGARALVDIITKSNFLGQSLLIGSTNTVSFMVWVVVSSIITISLAAGAGCILFDKSDIK